MATSLCRALNWSWDLSAAEGTSSRRALHRHHVIGPSAILAGLDLIAPILEHRHTLFPKRFIAKINPAHSLASGLFSELLRKCAPSMTELRFDNFAAIAAR